MGLDEDGVGPNGNGRAGDVLTIRFAPVPAGGIPSGVGGTSSPARPHE